MNKTGKILRITAIIFMGLTAAMNVLGGVGTVCAAFLTKKYPPMWALLEYQWLYQVIMIVTILIGVAGIWVTVGLVRGKANVYRNTLILLTLGTIVAGIQMYASLVLRGKAVPANMKFYINAVTLILFVIFKVPGIRERVDFTQPGGSTDKAASAGLASIVAGFTILTTFLWAGPSHTYMGNNWLNVLQTPLIISGMFFLLSGLGLVLRVIFHIVSQDTDAAVPEISKI